MANYVLIIVLSVLLAISIIVVPAVLYVKEKNDIATLFLTILQTLGTVAIPIALSGWAYLSERRKLSDELLDQYNNDEMRKALRDLYVFQKKYYPKLQGNTDRKIAMDDESPLGKIYWAAHKKFDTQYEDILIEVYSKPEEKKTHLSFPEFPAVDR